MDPRITQTDGGVFSCHMVLDSPPTRVATGAAFDDLDPTTVLCGTRLLEKYRILQTTPVKKGIGRPNPMVKASSGFEGLIMA